MREAGIDPGERLYLPGRKWHSQRTLSRIAPALLPTPIEADGTGGRTSKGAARPEEAGLAGTAKKLLPTPVSSDSHGASGEGRQGGVDLAGALTDEKLLPTPSASDGHGGEGATREARRATGNTGGPTLKDLGHYLPTPVANPENPGAGGELRAAIAHGETRRSPTPGTDSLGRPNRGRTPAEQRPFPTPTASARGDRSEASKEAGGGDELRAISKLLPTPTSGDAKASGSRNLKGSKANAGVSLTDATRFGNSTTPRRPTGERSPRPSSDGSTSSDEAPPAQLTIEDA